MILLNTFLDCVRENESRIHGYESGHDGSDGYSDCIGLIIGAVRLAGGSWPGVHGSNWAARNAMETFGRIADASKMFLGEIVYKAKEPGEDGYSLPDRYKNSGDLRDYYHVGVVTGVDPLEITHCTGVPGGIKFDTQMGNWRWGGKLKYVEYSEESGGSMKDEALYKAKVVAEKGKTVNMRKNPSTSSGVLLEVKIGETVDVLDVLDGWSEIAYRGNRGYMMSKYLLEIKPDNNGMTNSGEAKLEEAKSAMETAIAAAENAIRIIDKMLWG